MALLNFPSNPTVNQTYTIGNITYVWTGSAWIKLTSSGVTSIVVNPITESTSTVTGSVVITGGLGVGGSINAESTSTVNGSEIITVATLNNYVNPPVVTGGTDTVVTSNIVNSTEYILVWNTSTLQSVTDRGNSTTNVVHITNTSNAYSTTSGALVVDGGAGIGGDLWLGGTIYSAGVPVITTTTLVDSLLAGDDITILSTTTLSGNALIFSDVSTLQSVTTRGSQTNQTVYFTNTAESTSSSTGAVVISGGLGVAKRINAESLQIADAIMDSGEISVNTTSTIVVDEYPVAQYRSAKYLIQIEDGTGLGAQFETIEILLIVDNAQTVYATEYAVLSSNGDLGEFAADVQNDDIVRLYFTAYQASGKVIKIFRTGMTV